MASVCKRQRMVKLRTAWSGKFPTPLLGGNTDFYLKVPCWFSDGITSQQYLTQMIPF